MHEASLADNLLRIASQAAGDKAPRVRKVTVAVGVLAGVMTDALAFAFDALKGAAGLENAALSIETCPVRARCGDCGEEYFPEGFAFACVRCGSRAARIIGGEELFVKELEVEEEAFSAFRRKED